MNELTHFSLFSGIGGLDLSAEWAGFTTVGQCEWADYPTKVLEKHWPDVPRWRDIRSVTKQSFYERTGRRTVKLISGGFPCQPFSVAGKQRGKEDDRLLWPEMLRVISELQPDWVIGENVPGIINMALDQVLSDLESQGYEVQPFLIPACGVEAPHKRERVFIVANSISRGRREKWEQGSMAGISREWTNNTMQTEKSSPHVANTTGELRERDWGTWDGRAEFTNSGWWDVEPDVGRVANGIPSRVDRLKCLGNAVIPQQAYPIFQAIADIERST